MADHVKVSTTELREISKSVAKLKQNFDHSKDMVDSYGSDIGSDKVKDALGDFADDWKKKRKQLCDGLEFLGKTAGEAAKGYDDLDDHLAKALMKAAPKSKSKGGEGE